MCSESEISSAFIGKRRGKGRLASPPDDDLVRRELTPTSPDLPTDISEHPAGEGKVYPCAVKDV